MAITPDTVRVPIFARLASGDVEIGTLTVPLVWTLAEDLADQADADG